MLAARAARTTHVAAPPARPAARVVLPRANRAPALTKTLATRPLSSAAGEVNVRQSKGKTERQGSEKTQVRERSPALRSISAVGAPFGFDDFDTAMHNMDRFANRMMRPFGLNLMGPDFFRDFGITPAEGERARTIARWRPAVDIQEDKEKYTVHAELPGLRKEDVKVEVDEGVLTLRGERKMETKEEDKERRYTRVERQYGSFVRRFPVPKDVDQANIKATFKEGVLEVRLPRSAEKAKQSEITIE